MNAPTGRRRVLAIRVPQWLDEWNKVQWDPTQHKREPQHWFYLFCLPAVELKALTGIYRRTTESGLPRSLDLATQRRHEPQRSNQIREFVKCGYPWSELSEPKRESGRFENLRKPGWLPTAIVVNILGPDDLRARGQVVASEDMVTVESVDGNGAYLHLPVGFAGPDWRPRSAHPLEVIDGQHRLWAFESAEGETVDRFELPVVAFHGLDRSWQAYLFWTINIKPKRINRSLAYDLYPLLRTEDWLEQFEGHSVYRETRAQELVGTLWSHPASPWHRRINMLGEPGQPIPMVSQAAWIHSLLATYVKSYEGRGVRIGGLFGAPTGGDDLVLPWTLAQQSAFLIHVGTRVREAIEHTSEPWAEALRDRQQSSLFDGNEDPAFYGRHTLLADDMGIRGLLYVTNDLCYVRSDELQLSDWDVGDALEGLPDATVTTSGIGEHASDVRAISVALTSLENHPAGAFLRQIAASLSRFDWRASSAPDLDSDERSLKAALRGSGGYRELRRRLLAFLAEDSGLLGQAAREVQSRLRLS